MKNTNKDKKNAKKAKPDKATLKECDFHDLTIGEIKSQINKIAEEKKIDELGFLNTRLFELLERESEDEKDRIQNEKDILVSKIQELDEKYVFMEKKGKDDEMRIKNLIEEYDINEKGYKDEIDGLKIQANKLQNLLKKNTENEVSCRDEIERLGKQIKEVQLTNSELQREIKNKNNEIIALGEKINEYEKEVKKKINEINQLREQKEELGMTVEVLKRTIDQLNHTIQDTMGQPEEDTSVILSQEYDSLHIAPIEKCNYRISFAQEIDMMTENILNPNRSGSNDNKKTSSVDKRKSESEVEYAGEMDGEAQKTTKKARRRGRKGKTRSGVETEMTKNTTNNGDDIITSDESENKLSSPSEDALKVGKGRIEKIEQDIKQLQDNLKSIENSMKKMKNTETKVVLANDGTRSEPIKGNIYLIGDSHIRHLRKEIEQRVENRWTLLENFKPGYKFEKIVNELVPKSLKNDDILIISGGTNDLYRTEWDEIKKCLGVLTKNTCKILIILVPPQNSNCNKDIVKFNTLIKYYCQELKHVECIDPHRFLKPWHLAIDGIHVGRRGKSWLSQHIAENIGGKVTENTNGNTTKTDNSKKVSLQKNMYQGQKQKEKYPNMGERKPNYVRSLQPREYQPKKSSNHQHKSQHVREEQMIQNSNYPYQNETWAKSNYHPVFNFRSRSDWPEISSFTKQSICNKCGNCTNMQQQKERNPIIQSKRMFF
ncbi:hypothetical protein M8J76_014399 [Diaphorina citri]|nr:hypothetical protein M8J76_014399 [Diaphorina citri]KAI5735978.1 hypothetical protein M8J77_025038 [Diaphorina citri]